MSDVAEMLICYVCEVINNISYLTQNERLYFTAQTC